MTARKDGTNKGDFMAAENVKILGDLYLRWTSNFATPLVKYLEVVSYEQGDYCFTIAVWDKDKEGYNLRYIGTRPFEVNNQEQLQKLFRYGQAILDAEFNFNEE